MEKNTDETQRAVGYYDDFSRRYDDEREVGYFGFISDIEFESISPLIEGNTTLEIGCGTGLILRNTHLLAEKAIGVDISQGMVDSCLEKGLDARLIDGKILPFDDNSFDLVYSFKVLAHIPDICGMLKEIARVTKPSGKMVLEFYNPYSLKALNDWLRTRLNKNPVFLRHDSLKDIQRYLPKGVRIVSTRGVRIFGPVAAAYTLPLIGGFFRRIDRLACDGFWKRFGGYFIVELCFDDAH